MTEAPRPVVGPCGRGATGWPPPCGPPASTPARSRPSSRWPTTAARRDGCAASWASCPPGTCASAWWPWPRSTASWPGAFEQRFDSDADELAGHALGNLVIAGLMAVAGDLQEGLDEAARLLGAVGRVVPAATEPVVLKAVVRRGRHRGSDGRGRTPADIQRVSLVPADAGRRRRPWTPWPTPTRWWWARARCSRASWPPWPSSRGSPRPSGDRRAQTVYVANLRPQPAETDGIRRGRTMWPPCGPRGRGRRGAGRHRGDRPRGPRRCPWSSRAGQSRTGSPTIRQDWRQPWPVWSDRGCQRPARVAGQTGERAAWSGMTVRVGINGFGRIGRNFLRAARDPRRRAVGGRRQRPDRRRDQRPPPALRHAPTGASAREVQAEGDAHRRRRPPIRVLAEREPKALPWGELGVEVVIESTGRFTRADRRRRPTSRAEPGG